MKYTEFKEKLVDSFIEMTQSGIGIGDIERCCFIFGLLVGVLSVPDSINDEDLLQIFTLGYVAAKENNPVKEVVSIPIPKKST